MPFDGAPPTAFRRRWMPWRGRNAAILAQRHAPPRLPDGWGSSFGITPRAPCRSAPELPEAASDMPMADIARLADAGALQADQMLLALQHLAARGQDLPRLAEIARLLEWEDLSGREARNALSMLERRGAIRMIAGGRDRGWVGERIILLVATGAVLRTPGAPKHWALP